MKHIHNAHDVNPNRWCMITIHIRMSCLYLELFELTVFCIYVVLHFYLTCIVMLHLFTRSALSIYDSENEEFLILKIRNILGQKKTDIKI